jgi:hypothetical protein
MNGLQTAMADLETALNAMALENGFPAVDFTPLPPAVASKPGLYLAFADETRPEPPDLKWIQPVGSKAEFDLYVYFMVEPGVPLVKTLVDKLELVKDTIQALTTSTEDFRCFVSHAVPMYDWATRAWAGLMITITCDSYRNSSDG